MYALRFSVSYIGPRWYISLWIVGSFMRAISKRPTSITKFFVIESGRYFKYRSMMRKWWSHFDCSDGGNHPFGLGDCVVVFTFLQCCPFRFAFSKYIRFV